MASSIAKNIIKLASGTAGAQLLSIIVLPVLTRIYTPEAFGLSASFLWIAGIIGGFSTLSYHLAIPNAEDESEAKSLFLIGSGAVLFISFIALVVFYSNLSRMAQTFHFVGSEYLLLLVPLYVFFSGQTLLLNYWHTRKKNYGKITMAMMSRSAVGASGRYLLCGVTGAKSLGLVFADIISVFVSCLILLFKGRSCVFQGVFANMTRERFRHTVVKYRDYPCLMTISVSLNTLSWMLPAILIGVFFGAQTAGFYSIGFRVIQMPMSFIGKAVGQVFYQEAADLEKNGDRDKLSKLIATFFVKLVAVSFCIAIFLALFSPWVFKFFLGIEWEVAGEFVQLLSLWAFAWFAVSPLSGLVAILKLQKFGSVWNLVNLLGRLAIVFISYLWADEFGVMLGFSLFALLSYAVFVLYVFRSVGVDIGLLHTSVSRLYTQCSNILKKGK